MATAKEKFELAQQRYAATFERHLDNGVNFISRDVYIEPEVVIAPGATILPGCILRGKTSVGADCVIGPNTLLEDTVVEAGSTVNASQCYDSHIGPNNKIGPFSHLRTGTKTAEGLCRDEECRLCRGQHRQPPDLHRRCHRGQVLQLRLRHRDLQL